MAAVAQRDAVARLIVATVRAAYEVMHVKVTACHGLGTVAATMPVAFKYDLANGLPCGLLLRVSPVAHPTAHRSATDDVECAQCLLIASSLRTAASANGDSGVFGPGYRQVDDTGRCYGFYGPAEPVIATSIGLVVSDERSVSSLAVSVMLLASSPEHVERLRSDSQRDVGAGVLARPRLT